MTLAELVVEIGCDTSEYDRKVKGATSTANTFGDTFKGMLASNIVTKVFDLAVQGAQKALQAFVGFVKGIVEGYSEFQQLQGGVQKLYGNMGLSVEDYAATVGKSVDEVRGEWQNLETAQNLVMQNARNAYKTAGMDMNTYMETATSFSASLINSLNGDTIKAAEQTDVAMRAISDNWNTFGGDIGMIQQAYQGFAKQNYTMLDNLKLGYGGTKQEMERLIDDANEYAASIGQASDLSIDSFSDIVTAIDLVQQKQNIAGTTAREAGTTVQGSIGMVKAAWENLKIGLGDPEADVNELVDAVIEAAKTAAENLLPVIQNALEGIAELIKELVPIIEENLPWIEENLLPAIEDLISALIDIAVTVIIDLMPEILDAVQQIWDAVMENLEENHPILAGILELFMASTGLSVGQFFADMIQQMIQFWVDLFSQIQENLEEIRTWVSEKWEEFKTNAQEKWESIKTTISDKWEEIKTNVQEKVESVRSFVTEKWETLKSNTREKWESIRSTVRDKLENLRTTARDKAESIRSSLAGKWDEIRSNAQEKWESVKQTISDVVEKIKSFFPISIGKWLSDLPRLRLETTEKTFLGKTITIPTGFDWYAKAYENPYLLDTATVFGGVGFGDRGNYNGGELVYGHDNLMDDIREASASNHAGAILSMLNRIYELLQEGQTITIGRRDFARLVYEVN